MNGMLAAVRRHLHRFADGLGPLGAVGTLLATTCVGYFAGSVQPMRLQIDELRAGLRQGHDVIVTPAGPDAQVARLDRFVTGFPESTQLSQLLGSLYKLAEHDGLRLAQGEYRLVEADALGMLQYRIVLPVSGSYPRIRHFLGSALAEIPGLALTQFNLHRERIGQGQIAADIELTLHLRSRDPAYAKRSDNLEQLSDATEQAR